MNHKDILVEGCKNLEVIISDDQVKQFHQYYQLLVEWNEKINLTAITELEDVYIKHFLDSISVCAGHDFNQSLKVVDVGTGAGFPGFPLKIAHPKIELTAIDALNKRINYLNEVVRVLDLEKVQCVHSRAEDAAQNELYREQFDLSVSRAVADLAVLTEYCLPFVKTGGKFISLKGPSISEEINNARDAIQILGGEIEEIKYIDIPFSDLKHNLVIINKVNETPLKYPRKPSKIKKRPL
ncbi:16S rRNA (guanine(527)-N(7))-methyltransferase RsmG [Vallitalea okinawensis]|uniref:16S rRNA (guanine(527)-N(7))-methyltransferase RsmG n=1 Tax=Vallitalea okinawensis TaxID=2078660 RepID=UPI000CFD05F2|nr:16S rRNA (guanine(527)-N(7))-methyltransferase RsmG [Vallitalea okinawensis]